MKKIYIILLLLFTGLSCLYSQTVSQNYILTHTCTNDDGSTFLDKVQYFDGLGRPTQIVQKGITPAKADLATLQEYDAFGRNDKTWLPAVVAGNNGAYVAPATIQTNAISSNVNDAKPYSYPVYEASPLNRMLEQYGPGADWQNNGKSVKTNYQTNSGTSGQLSCALFSVSGTGVSTKVYRNNFYPDAQLYVTKTTDEDGNLSYQFKDKLDKVVLTRQILNGDNIDTYYVYDDFGNLCFVLPPLASDGIANGTWDETNSAAVKDYGYIYRYDSRNRCIQKKLPGCEAIYYVYDTADRLIFTQDGEQRKKSEWTFSIPDALGRIVLAGICKDTINVSNKLVKGVFSTAGIYKAYTIQVDGVAKTFINVPSILSVNYYDNYDFLGYNGIPNDANTLYNVENGYGEWYGTDYTDANKYKNKGLLTGTLTAQMNPDGTISSTYLYSVMYHDYRSRLVQVKGNNSLPGGLEKEYIAYDFMNNPTGKKHVHSATGKTTQTEIYVNTYDHAGRLTKTTHQLNSGTIVTLAENAYDEQGRLSEKTKGQMPITEASYFYNVRSWLRGISGQLLTEYLYYNEMYGGNVRCYNGNLSAMEWRFMSEPYPRSYIFSYDNLSRLTDAKYLEDNMVSSNYKVSYPSYDKQGNILSLQRYGKTTATTYGLIDNLTMTYAGNQLLTANDAVANIPLAESADFKNYSVTTPEYAYNANGAMTKDLNKGISDIQYNLLNLPGIMDIKSPVAEARNEYTYSASGQKLKLVQNWNPNYSTAPVIGSAINTGSLTQSKTTEYIGNMIYENGALKRILIDGGYIDGGIYIYYITDHQGNNRTVVSSANMIVQSNHYYPFGMAFAETPIAEQGKQPYKFGGKELDPLSGLNLYDYSARYYESALGRFMSIDPLCEKYYSISPYVYCANNPINAIDPDGQDFRLLIQRDKDGNITGLTIESTVYITGENASAERASELNKMVKDIYRSKIMDGIKVSFNVNYEYNKDITASDLKSGDNLFDFNSKVSTNDDRSHVHGSRRGDVYQTGNTGEIYSDADNGAVMHETGHFLGLADRYDDFVIAGKIQSIPHWGYGNDLMGSSRNKLLDKSHYYYYVLQFGKMPTANSMNVGYQIERTKGGNLLTPYERGYRTHLKGYKGN